MNRKTKILSLPCLFLVNIFLFSFYTSAKIVPAKSATQQDVETAINTATYGDIVTIPACSSGIFKLQSSIVVTKNMSIVGAGVDKTIIGLGFNDDGTEEACLKFVPDSISRNNLDNMADSHSFEILRITFVGNNRMKNKFGIWIENMNMPAIRRVKIHDCKFTDIHRAVQVIGYVHGVFYQNRLVNTNGSYPQGGGSASFSNDRMTLGSGDGWYIEDNTFSYTNGSMGDVCGGGNSGGGYVCRYNTVTGQMNGGETVFETHGNQPKGIYGPQITEIYGNNVIATGYSRVTNARGGKNIYFNNIFTDPDIQIWEEYSDAQTSSIYPTGKCPESDKARQTCTDGCVCQKVHDSYFFNNRFNTVTGLILNAVVEMDYKNRADGILNDPPELEENIEFYNSNTAFNGTTGIGCGTLGNRPETCDIGVGYWATNQSCSDLSGMVGVNPSTPIKGTLYKCISKNVWTKWYAPFFYPHPLRKGSKPDSLGCK